MSPTHYFASNHEGLFVEFKDGNVRKFIEKDGNIHSAGILLREREVIYAYSLKNESISRLLIVDFEGN